MTNSINNQKIDLSALGFGAKDQATKPRDQLGQADFLKLLTAQISNQNPLDPQDGKEFLSQLTSFSMTDGIQKLQESFSQVSASLQSSQALQASALVGRVVMVPAEQGLFEPTKGLSGSASLGSSTTDLTVSIFNEKGELQRQMRLGPQSAGDIHFHWDGTKEDGSTATPGMYRVKATAMIGGNPNNLETLVGANVDSVTLDKARGLLLNLAGLGQITFDSVKAIGQ